MRSSTFPSPSRRIRKQFTISFEEDSKESGLDTGKIRLHREGKERRVRVTTWKEANAKRTKHSWTRRWVGLEMGLKEEISSKSDPYVGGYMKLEPRPSNGAVPIRENRRVLVGEG